MGLFIKGGYISYKFSREYLPWFGIGTIPSPYKA